MNAHSFHIPVMGIGFTVDTPLRVSQHGIDSVVSLVDDILLEKLRKMYCEKFKLPYQSITEDMEDFRAKRITSYLNMLNNQARKNFEEFKLSAIDKKAELLEYFSMLPTGSVGGQKLNGQKLNGQKLNGKAHTGNGSFDVDASMLDELQMGSIDVNIMTKLDKENYSGDDKLPIEYNDAHAAVRGFANSDLSSSLVLSAGMSPRLYSYLEHFDDFYPDENGVIKKKIVLKVSDYRSAFIQGKFLAKKGIWVSEYRIESGLNCGGHAFATDGYLMGPILSEFRDNRENLSLAVREILDVALAAKNRVVPKSDIPLKLTAQGGVGTAEEHQFLIDHYGVDSVGWGTPFLLVEEVTNVDDATREQLRVSLEKDLYLSDVSPLGIPFNNMYGNSKDAAKKVLIDKNKPGSSCPKKFLVSNKEYTDRHICLASRQFQHQKLKDLDELGLPVNEHQDHFDSIVERGCICVGLGTSALLVNDLETKVEGPGVSVCPGPNLAYFSQLMSLKNMTDHIYGRANMITRTDRPHMFVKELGLYLDYFKDEIEKARSSMQDRKRKYLLKFADSLEEGIDYYQDLFTGFKDLFADTKVATLAELQNSRKTLSVLSEELKVDPLAEDVLA